MGNILVVEDNETIANGLVNIIRSINDGLNVKTTGYAEEAIRYAGEVKWDVFLLDIQLKDYSGIELAKKLREVEKYKLTPIVFITSIPNEELNAFRKIHCYDYIIKPFKEAVVKETLKTIIEYGIREIQADDVIKIKKKFYSNMIKQKEIIYIEARLKDLEIVTVKERLNVKDYSLKKLFEELNGDFLQCHRSYVLNKSYLEHIDHIKNEIKLRELEQAIPIGRTYKKRLMEDISWE
ncbi:transcriptional regulatory protein YehT [Andreesenia angusta]|uniref:Transcriptional regulatory protein YehT n=1 Tax=Andreesenia angusta TaxID=39480 RepID=A0A1S1V892_9FIRM|nr:LytTR family DNA-binding domain-containing protein [Andreesenia angusta]OHW62377.1 transcriptional regulatory protein YehT [Andreesenia angusta]